MRNPGEFSTPTDLTARPDLPPSEVVEFLGRENVKQVEDNYARASKSMELATKPNPFEVYSGRIYEFIKQDMEVSLNSIETLAGGLPLYLGSNRDEVFELAKDTGLVLRKTTLALKKTIRDNINHANKQMQTEEAGLDDLEAHPDAVEEYLPSYFESHELIAKNLVSPVVAKDMFRVATAEINNTHMRAVLAMVRKNPAELNELLALRDAAAVHGGNNLVAALSERLSELRIEGEKLREVKKYCRSAVEVWADQATAKGYVDTISDLRNDWGSELHRRMTTLARQQAAEPSYAALLALDQLHKHFIDLCRELPEDMQDTALEAEHYISSRAEQVHNFLRASGFKLDENDRRIIHEIKDRDLERRIRRAASVLITAAQNPYENVQTDETFRRQCRDARDILVGGGRINHPDAKRLSHELHKLRFGKNMDIQLEPADSGILVGLKSGKLDSLLSIVGQLESEESAQNAQLEKLRIELPDQYKVLKGFNFDLSLNNLMSLISNPDDRQAILSAFNDRGSGVAVLDAISSLWHERNGIERPANDEAAEEHQHESEELENEESQPEYQPTEQELELIDDAMAEIADQLEWVVFPPGVKLQDIQRRFSGDNVDLSRVNWERIQHLLYLSDTFDGRIYRSREAKLGTTVPYLVAEFTAKGRIFAVAECPEIGNATYVVDNSIAAGTWEELMRLSKAEARSLGARRIIHPKEAGHLNKILKTINSLLLVKTS